MPFGPSGIWSAISLPGSFNPALAGSDATPEAWNAFLADMTSSYTQTITKNGLTTATANLPMGGFKHTGVADATAANQYLTLGQAKDSGATFGVVGGTPDVITLTMTPATTAYKVGQQFWFKTAVGSNTTNVTLNVDGLGAGAVVTTVGTVLGPGELQFERIIGVAVVSTTPSFQIISQASSAVTQAAGNSSTKVATTAFVQAAVGKVYVQTFTASGTYTPQVGMVNCIIECVGGGGGGGGTVTGAGNQGSGGGGGGAGSYSRTLSTAAAVGASQVVTIGAAGAAGASGNNAGGNGGDTSVGALCIGKGGTGGSGSDGANLSVTATGGAGGVSGTGTVTSVGEPGVTANVYNLCGGLSGAGGSGPFGGGGRGVVSATTTVGAAGSGKGSGGSGGASYSGGGAAAGGLGTAGYVVVTEFCNQ